MNMLLPPQDGFASNINIQHQLYPGTLKEYAALSKTQSRQSGLTVTAERIDETAYTAEAVGKLPGLEIELRFYFRAIKVGDHVVLATATAPASRWETDRQLLSPIIDSLKPILE